MAVGTSHHYQRTITEEGGLSLELLNGAYQYTWGPVQFMRSDDWGRLYLLVRDANLVPGRIVHAVQGISESGQLLGTVAVLDPVTVPGPGGTPTTYERPTGMDVDNSGRVYVTGVGTANGAIVPTANAFQPTRLSAGDEYYGFLLRVDTLNGFTIDYATYIGGSNSDEVNGVAVDRATGHVFLGGSTRSQDFPVTPSPLNPPFLDTFPTAFVMALDLTASTPPAQLVLSTILGESSTHVEDIALLPGGVAIAGTAGYVGYPAFGLGFPEVDAFAVSPSTDARPFVSVFSRDGQQLLLSTALNLDPATASYAPRLAANGSGVLYVATSTDEASRATAGSAQTSHGGYFDALVHAFSVQGGTVNDPPEIELLPDVIDLTAVAPWGVSFRFECGVTFSCQITDPDGDAVEDFLWTGPGGFTLHSQMQPGAGELSLQPGSHRFMLFARDARGAVGASRLAGQRLRHQYARREQLGGAVDGPAFRRQLPRQRAAGSRCASSRWTRRASPG